MFGRTLNLAQSINSLGTDGWTDEEVDQLRNRLYTR